MTIHEDPERAPCDGPNMLRLADLPRLLDEMQAIRSALDQKATFEPKKRMTISRK